MVRVWRILLPSPTGYVRFLGHFFSELESLFRLHDNEEVSCLTVHSSFVFEKLGQLRGNPVCRVDRENSNVEQRLILAFSGQFPQIRLSQEVDFDFSVYKSSQEMPLPFLLVAFSEFTLFNRVQIDGLGFLLEFFN